MLLEYCGNLLTEFDEICPAPCSSFTDCSSCLNKVRCGWCSLDTLSISGFGLCTEGSLEKPHLGACAVQNFSTTMKNIKLENTGQLRSNRLLSWEKLKLASYTKTICLRKIYWKLLECTANYFFSILHLFSNFDIFFQYGWQNWYKKRRFRRAFYYRLETRWFQSKIQEIFPGIVTLGWQSVRYAILGADFFFTIELLVSDIHDSY